VITKHDLETAIAECQGKQNPDSKTCMMLAAFYTIRREMFGEEKEAEHYSFAPAPVRNIVEINSDSEFARAINGMDLDEFYSIMNELMETIQIIQPRLYDAVMMKLV
jgi:hypothetical protein